ncbi:hypothetical protein KV100_19075 [Mumia sp. zg.B21]|uniref:hypothetical protein n=1 Tax=Mumia sp. zg.B21 TaxID=2855447 RepID=UPI001C6DFD46|nr:hypothetical protein [Mumia sp. zg.B21]MBW9211757.1 hypothetical protein [Mumia sp. zg.B21]
MDEIWSWLGAVGTILIGAGLGTVAGNIGIEFIKGTYARNAQTRALDHARTMQMEEREHAAALRREQNLFDARRELLPKVAQVREWIDFEWGLDHAPEDVYVSQASRPRFEGVGEALRALDEVATHHPSRQVRAKARDLYDRVDGVFADMSQNLAPYEAHVAERHYGRWVEECDELIEALNEPEHSFHRAPSEAERP